MTKTEPEMVGVLERAAKIKREGCTTCNGHGYINCIPRDGGEMFPCLCGNCSEAARPQGLRIVDADPVVFEDDTPTPAPIPKADPADHAMVPFTIDDDEAPIESTLADEMEALACDCDEGENNDWEDHEWRTAADLLRRAAKAVRTPPQSGEVSQEQVEAVARAILEAMAERSMTEAEWRGAREHEDWHTAESWARAAIAAIPPPPSVEVGLADCEYCGGNGYSGGIMPAEEMRGEYDCACEVCLGSGKARQQPIGVVEDGVERLIEALERARSDFRWISAKCASDSPLPSVIGLKAETAAMDVAVALSSPTDTKGEAK